MNDFISKKQKPFHSKKRIIWFLYICRQCGLNSPDLQKYISRLIKTDLLDRHVVYKSTSNSSATQLLFYPTRFSKRDMKNPFATKTYVWKYDNNYHHKIETKHYYFSSSNTNLINAASKINTNPEIIYYKTNQSLVFPQDTIFHLRMPPELKEYATNHLEKCPPENLESKQIFFGLIGTLPWYGSGCKF